MTLEATDKKIDELKVKIDVLESTVQKMEGWIKTKVDDMKNEIVKTIKAVRTIKEN